MAVAFCPRAGLASTQFRQGSGHGSRGSPSAFQLASKSQSRVSAALSEAAASRRGQGPVPYRLPRICHPDPPPVDLTWGRFGYQVNVRMPELEANVRRSGMKSPSSSVRPPDPLSSRSDVGAAQRHRQSSTYGPAAAHLPPPPMTSPHARQVGQDAGDPSAVFRSLMERGVHTDPHNPAPSLAHYPHSRSVSPAKSIHWALGSTKHAFYDYKGQSRNQGPYSREFTVHCMAPNSWLRMKWGRQRTSVH